MLGPTESSEVPQPKKFFPLPGRYGVIQIDPVAMVEELQDDEALEAARAMQPKKYIAYISANIELPWPKKLWYGYIVCPIGTTLRPEDPAKALTPEMCIPIAPNKAHPAGRSPIITEPPFPFSNCFHWVDTATRVRIRAGLEFDEAHAIWLNHDRQVDMQEVFEEDLNRAYDVLDEREAAAEAERRPQPDGMDKGDAGSDAGASGMDARSLLEGSEGKRRCDCSSCSTPSRTSSVNSLDAIAAFDPFGFHPDEDAMFYPLVDFCFDLTDHLTQEEIPSPVDFWKERDQIVAIIRAAQERASRRRSFNVSDDELDTTATPEEIVNEIRNALKGAAQSSGALAEIPPAAHEGTAIKTRNRAMEDVRRGIRQHTQHIADALHLGNTFRRLKGGARQASRALTFPYISCWP